MNQINIGAGCVIDTDEIQYSETRDWGDDGKRVLVMFKNGQEAILRGEAKDAFDAWAARDASSCQTCTVFDDDQGRCTWTIGHVPFPTCYEAREAAEPEGSKVRGCFSCDREDDTPGCCADPNTPRDYPDCYKAKPA